ncbi:DUF3833 family protein [Chachezhania antarctica]|uniref:DUF3833 family protein n=1 Tax=Chachezhania antarctica TaxID=2340860 RepID=UPI0030844ABE
MALVYTLLGAALVCAVLWLRHRQLSFSAQRTADYAGLTPIFDLREHLNGKMLCDGVVYGPTGRVAASFNGRFEILWDGDRAKMSEHFTYDSGTEQLRQWALVLGEDGSITATAPDVIGEGRGKCEGSAVQLNYRLRLPESGGGHVVDVTDWMYLAPNGHIVNRSQFRKYGLVVGELIATMRPVEVRSHA